MMHRLYRLFRRRRPVPPVLPVPPVPPLAPSRPCRRWPPVPPVGAVPPAPAGGARPAGGACASGSTAGGSTRPLAVLPPASRRWLSPAPSACVPPLPAAVDSAGTARADSPRAGLAGTRHARQTVVAEVTVHAGRTLRTGNGLFASWRTPTLAIQSAASKNGARPELDGLRENVSRLMMHLGSCCERPSRSEIASRTSTPPTQPDQETRYPQSLPAARRGLPRRRARCARRSHRPGPRCTGCRRRRWGRSRVRSSWMSGTPSKSLSVAFFSSVCSAAARPWGLTPAPSMACPKGLTTVPMPPLVSR